MPVPCHASLLPKEGALVDDERADVPPPDRHAHGGADPHRPCQRLGPCAERDDYLSHWRRFSMDRRDALCGGVHIAVFRGRPSWGVREEAAVGLRVAGVGVGHVLRIQPDLFPSRFGVVLRCGVLAGKQFDHRKSQEERRWRHRHAGHRAHAGLALHSGRDLSSVPWHVQQRLRRCIGDDHAWVLGGDGRGSFHASQPPRHLVLLREPARGFARGHVGVFFVGGEFG
mmetsp:Transcript_19654/g.58813  ORF Transcript_19654/g.58813 Transcript_19654/m.58813 type:complete len:227 (+) Transcript_19654:88-768(+)